MRDGAITEAFSEAERPTAGGPGKGTDCPVETIGMAWVILPSGVKTIGKDGQVTGFASQMLLMATPVDAAIVVLTNSTNGNPDIMVWHILFSLYRAGLLAH